MTDVADAAQKLQPPMITRAAAHQPSVDFDVLHGQRLQIIERREARTEIIERKPRAQGNHSRHEVAHGRGAPQGRGLGDFNAQLPDDGAGGA